MTSTRPPLWKRLLRRAAFGLVATITLIALALSVIAFQGRREWAKTKTDLLARGEKLSLVELTPPPIPSEQNVFADPMWAELFDLKEPLREGAAIAEPRTPKGQRILDVLSGPASPEILARAGDLLPKEKYRFASDHVSTVQIAAGAALARETDPGRRAAFAQLLLDTLAPAGPVLARARALLKRPGAWIPQDHSRGFAPVSFITLPYLLRLGQCLGARASAQLALDHPDEAAADVLALFRLARALRNEPTLMLQHMRQSIEGVAVGVVATGMRRHAWTEEQLLQFDEAAWNADLQRGLARGLRGERGYTNQFFETLRFPDPRGNDSAGGIRTQTGDRPVKLPFQRWLAVFDAGHQAAYNRWMQRQIDLLERASEVGIAPRELTALMAEFIERLKPWHPLHAPLIDAVPVYESAFQRSLWGEDCTRQHRIAIALERYRLRHGTYPDTLSALVPTLLPVLPISVIAGEPFRYRRESPDRFRLWSAGWDAQDDGGVPSKSRGVNAAGDWVWSEAPGSRR